MVWITRWIGIFTLDLGIGLSITWLIDTFARRLFRDGNVPRPLQAFFTETPPSDVPQGAGGRNKVPLRLWSFSVFVGILSHIGFDLISHDTNLLLYPWVKILVGIQAGGTGSGLRVALSPCLGDLMT